MTELEEQNQLEPKAQGEREETPKKQKKGKVWLKVVVALVLLAAAVVLLLRACGPQGERPSLERELTAELGLLPGMSEQEIQDRLNRKVAESMMNVSINPKPEFPSGEEPGNLRIENIPGNSCSFTVTLVRSDTGETILTTGLIDPGYYVEKMKLDTPLPQGEYPCVAVFTGYDTQSQEQLGQAGTTLLLTVKS